MKKLHVTFLNEAGKKHSWSPSVASETLNAQEVKAAADKLASLNLFAKDGILLYQKAEAAKYVETIETELF